MPELRLFGCTTHSAPATRDDAIRMRSDELTSWHHGSMSLRRGRVALAGSQCRLLRSDDSNPAAPIRIRASCGR